MNVESHMELDSHTNMPVVGKHAYIIAETGKKVDVSPFMPDYHSLMVPLVDAMVINEYFRNSFGMTNIPLTYVTREHTKPMEGEEDTWDAPLDQMIDWAPYFIPQVGANPARHPTFIVDNKTLFDKLAEMTRSYACWSYVKPFLHSRNGQAVYVAFHNHYLGPNNIDNMAALAEQKLNSTTYKGEGHRWDFE